VIPQVLWAEACFIAVHIKNCLPYSDFKLKKSPYKIIFGHKSSIKYLYPFGFKYYLHIPEEK
jgi:hypothetical protein